MGLDSDALALIAKVRKTYGENAITLASDIATGAYITSGSLALDVALGGGWPTNKWTEILGKESHGKTTIVLKTIAANQALNPEFTTLWIAAEHYNRERAEELGVDNDHVIVVNTQAMEFAYTTILEFATSRTVDCIVLDSYPALIPSEEADKEMGDAVMAVGARLTGKFFRKVGESMIRSMDGNDRAITCFFINQYRDAIGAYSPRGTPKTSPGGNAKNYAFWCRVEITRDEFIDEARHGKGKVRVGQVIKAKTVKNKSAAPQRVASVDFYFADAPVLGFLRGAYDLTKEYLTYGVLYDIIRRGGATFYYGDRKWRGREDLLASIREEVDLQEELRAKILSEAARPDSERMREQEIA